MMIFLVAELFGIVPFERRRMSLSTTEVFLVVQAGIQCDQCEQWYHTRPGRCDKSPKVLSKFILGVFGYVPSAVCRIFQIPFSIPPWILFLLESNYFNPLNGSNFDFSPLQPNSNYKSNTSHQDKRNSKQSKTKEVIMSGYQSFKFQTHMMSEVSY